MAMTMLSEHISHGEQQLVALVAHISRRCHIARLVRHVKGAEICERMEVAILDGILICQVKRELLEAIA